MFSFFRSRQRRIANTIQADRAAAQPRQFVDGLPVVATFADGSVEVSGPHRNFIVSADRGTWAPID